MVFLLDETAVAGLGALTGGRVVAATGWGMLRIVWKAVTRGCKGLIPVRSKIKVCAHCTCSRSSVPSPQRPSYPFLVVVQELQTVKSTS